MSKNYQDLVLNSVRKEKMQITIFLLNGFKIKGTVISFDNYVIVMETEGKMQMVYKHGISTIIPAKQLNLNLQED